MKKRTVFLPVSILALTALSCILQLQAAPTLSLQQIQTYSAQTMMFIQWQTLSAGGAGTTVLPGETPPTSGPADTATNTMLPTVTSTGTPLPTSTFTPTVTNTPVPCNWAQYISDVTYPDNSEVGLSDHFTKTWRLKNIGSCTWTSGYSLVFDHGDQMGAPLSQQLTTGTVSPGGTIDVSVELISPAAPGTYQGFFKLRASDSSIFGIGPDANGAFWVKVKAVGPTVSIIQVQADATVVPGNWNKATAECPAGSIVVGGGYDVYDNLVLYNHGKDGNGWRVYARNYTASNRALTAYAFCLTGVSGSSTQVEHDTTLSGGSVGNSIANCPGGSVVTGLGFASSPDYMWVYRSDMVGNSARAYGKNLSGSNQIIRAHAVCLTAAGVTTVQAVNSATVAAHTALSLEVSCPPGTIATGAGYAIAQPLVSVGLKQKAGSSGIVARANNLSGSNLAFQAFAVCLAVS